MWNCVIMPTWHMVPFFKIKMVFSRCIGVISSMTVTHGQTRDPNISILTVLLTGELCAQSYWLSIGNIIVYQLVRKQFLKKNFALYQRRLTIIIYNVDLNYSISITRQTICKLLCTFLIMHCYWHCSPGL